MTAVMIDLERWIPPLRAYFAQQPDVRFVYVYGSVARGQTWAESDLDLGVWLADGLSPHEQFHRNLDMASEIEQLLGQVIEVDVRRLNDAPIEFLWEVYYHGRCVFAHAEQERVNFEVRVMREYFDFKPVLDAYYRELFKRIKTGEPSAERLRHQQTLRARFQRTRTAGKLSGPLA